MNSFDYFCIVNRQQREILVRHIQCSIRSICFICLLTLLSSERKHFKMCLKNYVLYIVAFLVCQEYPILYANGRLACLMLACQQNTLQGMLGVLIERYEIFAYDFERQEAPTTYHVVDVRVLQRVVKTAIS